MNIISKLLGGPSPFDQLEDHHHKVMECVDLAIPILEAALDDDRVTVDELSKKIFIVEHEADEIKLDIRDNLPRAKLLPVARPDLLAFLKEQDNLADMVEDLAMMLAIRPFRLPEKNCETLRDEMLGLGYQAVYAARHASRMFDRIGELRDAAFSGKVADELRENADEVSGHEYKADKHQYRIVRCVLTTDDPEWTFADAYTLMEVVRAFSGLANHAESMTDYLRLMIAE